MTQTTPPRPGAASLAEVLAAIRGVDGWLTLDQAARLHAAAQTAPPGGRIVEIGSFRGRSTIVLALSADADAEVVAIDPHAGTDRGPREIEGYEAEAADDHATFRANLAAAGVAERVRHVRSFSSEAHGAVDGPIDVLFIDGAHRYGPALDDIRRWGAQVAPGGRMLIHDAFSSVGVTLAILTAVLPSGGWRYEGRSGSLAEYRRARTTPAAVAAQVVSLAWFARNVAVKALIVAKLGRLTRYLGHRQPTWPY